MLMPQRTLKAVPQVLVLAQALALALVLVRHRALQPRRATLWVLPLCTLQDCCR